MLKQMWKELELKSDQEELLIVVDKDDNTLNYLPRKQVHTQKLLHRTISISVFNDKGEILLHKRSMNKDNNPGFWGNASGGHVVKGEDYDQAAHKEINEELNINPKLILIKKMFINDPVHNTMTSLYKAYSNGPFEFNKEEIDEIKFFSIDKLDQIKDKLSESAKIVLREQGLI